MSSLRSASFTSATFDAATGLVPTDVDLVEAPLADVRLYNRNVEANGDPAPVQTRKQAMETGDVLIVFTPEYNRGVPAVTLNAIDWLSRPPGDGPLARATVGIVGATAGRHEAAGVRGHHASSVGANTNTPFELSLGLGSIARRIEHGRQTADEARRRPADWMADFLRYVKEQHHDT